VEFGVEVAVAILGTVAAALVWLRRRPANPVTLMLLALVVATALVSLQGASGELAHSLGVLGDSAVLLVGPCSSSSSPTGG
jgi:uncharacterized membrane protein